MSGLAHNPPAAVAQFVEAMSQGRLIGNLTTEMRAFALDGQMFPLSLNARDEGGNCYLCRPSCAYIDYALDEIRHFRAQPVLYTAMKSLLHMARPLVQASGLDTQVQVNNWLFSTNPVPHLGAHDVGQLRDRLTAAYPARAIVLRSLNRLADQGSMDALRAAGFRLLPARRIWILDCRDGGPQKSRDQRRDQALWADGRFEIVPHEAFGPEDFEAAATLYAQLYLEKYSGLNPHYRASFMAALHKAGILHFAGLRHDGRLVAVTGIYESGATLTQPIVGYDTTLPVDLALYRRMMAYATLRAREGRKFFNMSAGAAGFKHNRGARAVIEYTAVYVAHLPRTQRAMTRVMEKILHGIGIPLLERFDL